MFPGVDRSFDSGKDFLVEPEGLVFLSASFKLREGRVEVERKS